MANSVLSTGILLLLCLVAGAYARPCKTLFYFTASTTDAVYPFNPLAGKPDSKFLIRNQGPRHLTLIFSSSANRLSDEFSRHWGSISGSENDASSVEKVSDLPLQFYSSISRSIRDRSEDIMSVVRALFFGIGCGALTAAIMYLLWALFSPRRFDLEDVSSSSDDDDDDDVVAIKKKLGGYVIIPTQPKALDDYLKKPAPAPATV